MSTRCQVKVLAEEPEAKYSENVTLYHHCDGSPGRMIPLIYKAWRFGTSIHDKTYPNFYLPKVNRAGHVAAYLCYANPLQFEPESGHDLHGDIEWYYKVYVSHLKAKLTKVRGENVSEWMVEIHIAHGGYSEEPTETECVYKNLITRMVTRKGKFRVDIARKIKEKNDVHIGMHVAGAYI